MKSELLSHCSLDIVSELLQQYSLRSLLRFLVTVFVIQLREAHAGLRQEFALLCIPARAVYGYLLFFLVCAITVFLFSSVLRYLIVCYAEYYFAIRLQRADSNTYANAVFKRVKGSIFYVTSFN